MYVRQSAYKKMFGITSQRRSTGHSSVRHHHTPAEGQAQHGLQQHAGRPEHTSAQGQQAGTATAETVWQPLTVSKLPFTVTAAPFPGTYQTGRTDAFTRFMHEGLEQIFFVMAQNWQEAKGPSTSE